MRYDPLNIVVCGIGGQGNILASELLGSALVEKGYKVAVGETYGASQRGGSVMSHIRVSGKTELGVLIPDGEAHVIIGFEPLETLRLLRRYGGSQTVAIYDPREVYPLGVLTGDQTYPDVDELKSEIAVICKRAFVIPAADIALSAQNPKAANIALMGALSAIDALPLEPADYALALKQRFKGSVLEMNERVFALGRDALLEQKG